MRSLILAVLLPACLPAQGSMSDDSSCNVSSPCPGMALVYCDVGAEAEGYVPDRAIAHALISVIGAEGGDIMAPLPSWEQTGPLVTFTCPDETEPGSGKGAVLVLYYQT